MRIAELSARSGVTVPTIKYYLRERLLPPGEVTGRNQAVYDHRHLQRLRLIRALREVGGLSVAATGEVLAALDDPDHTSHHLMGATHRAVLRRPGSPGGHPRRDPEWEQARAEAAERVRQLGWLVDPQAPALDQLADVILALRRIGHPEIADRLPDYAETALPVAQWEVAYATAADDPAVMMARVAAGTVLGEALLATVRLLAHEHVSATETGHERPDQARPMSPTPQEE